MARTSNSARKSQSAAYKRTPYQKTAYVNGTAVRHAEAGEELERHLDQRTGSMQSTGGRDPQSHGFAPWMSVLRAL